VRLVDHQQGTMLSANLDDSRQVDDVAFHTEDCVHHDQGGGVALLDALNS
jgi:hypothetical protein